MRKCSRNSSSNAIRKREKVYVLRKSLTQEHLEEGSQRKGQDLKDDDFRRVKHYLDGRLAEYS